MPIEVEPAAVRAAWSHGQDAAIELDTAAGRTQAAGGFDLDAVSDVVADAAADLHGVLDIVRAVVDEHGTGLEDCVRTFEATDGHSAGEFNALGR